MPSFTKHGIMPSNVRLSFSNCFIIQYYNLRFVNLSLASVTVLVLALINALWAIAGSNISATVSAVYTFIRK